MVITMVITKLFHLVKNSTIAKKIIYFHRKNSFKFGYGNMGLPFPSGHIHSGYIMPITCIPSASTAVTPFVQSHLNVNYWKAEFET